MQVKRCYRPNDEPVKFLPPLCNGLRNENISFLGKHETIRNSTTTIGLSSNRGIETGCPPAVFNNSVIGRCVSKLTFLTHCVCKISHFCTHVDWSLFWRFRMQHEQSLHLKPKCSLVLAVAAVLLDRRIRTLVRKHLSR